MSDPVTKLPTGLKPHLIFEYDASGNRVSKISIDKTGKVLKTLYLRDASGNVMSTYKTNTSIFLALGEQYLFGSARLGMIDNRGRSYELTDHLGNVRAVVEENKTVASATDYYPFGMVAEQYALSGGYRFGFNGKEKEDEGTGGGGSTYDYGMRIYNGNIARFLSTDPLTSKYPWYTPYQFAGNKPISHIDLDGLEEAKPKYNLTGNLVIALKDDEQVYNQAENTSGSWDIIYVNNLSEASTWLKENYGEKKLDNLVVVSHGTRPDRSYGPGFLLEHDNSQLKNSTEDAAAKKGKLAVNDKDFKNYNTEPTGDLLQDEKNKQVGYIKDINSYVSENGKVLYAECWLGKNKALVEEISKTLPQNAQLYTTELATNTFSGKAVASDPAFLKIGQPITLGMPYGYNDPKNDIQVSKVQTQPSWNVTTNKGKNSVELDKKKKTDLQLSKDGKIEEVNINKK
ncbi:MAG TPA: RHS repeat-associated core domain-containing protein [Cytophagales bacterium]|nr:RHS repeat-associated core domain-containing protein [Cytophagales bacterium]